MIVAVVAVVLVIAVLFIVSFVPAVRALAAGGEIPRGTVSAASESVPGAPRPRTADEAPDPDASESVSCSDPDASESVSCSDSDAVRALAAVGEIPRGTVSAASESGPGAPQTGTAAEVLLLVPKLLLLVLEVEPVSTRSVVSTLVPEVVRPEFFLTVTIATKTIVATTTNTTIMVKRSSISFGPLCIYIHYDRRP